MCAAVKSVFLTWNSSHYRPAAKTGRRYNDAVSCPRSPSYSVTMSKKTVTFRWQLDVISQKPPVAGARLEKNVDDCIYADFNRFRCYNKKGRNRTRSSLSLFRRRHVRVLSLFRRRPTSTCSQTTRCVFIWVRRQWQLHHHHHHHHFFTLITTLGKTNMYNVTTVEQDSKETI